ncbi:MAG TPA: exodeoxyribonuclease VII small subunit [Candidatus Limiplasma sp.]|nr:exodeoxyribonuclease VII small subunit [Candidatus Limiplasma sp.]HPS82098.1 exodeoxyribonuclease VII small subunit [Candidatus Limiplasma sp.]
MTAKKGNREPTFEEELARLEALAEKMEQSDLPLDELVQAFEEGSQLAQALQAKLEAAKARLSEVKANRDGTLAVTPSAVVVQASLLDDVQP